jgi:response regulator RpfG family c-di-GMP phosphodiesterase
MTKVLYIEHDDDNLYMLKMRLERVGDFEILASEKGCKLAATERPDVILMDLEMPVVDRWEPVRILKNDPQTRDIPIIACPRMRWTASVRRPSPRAATNSRVSARHHSARRRKPEIIHPLC